MFKKIKSWNGLVNFIIRKRIEGCTRFSILTTGYEIIITTNPMPHEKVEKEQFRLRYKK